MSYVPLTGDTVETTKPVKYSLGPRHEDRIEPGTVGEVADHVTGMDGTTALVQFREISRILWVHASNLKEHENEH